MTHILHIDASANTTTSISRAASAKLVADLGGTVTYRDLAETPLPQIDGAWADARLTDPDARSAEDAAHLTLSDEIVAEAVAADVIVIGAPIYNFAAPASLKAWMDLIARPRVTFRYTENGPEGLLTGKKAIIAVASGGVPVGSEMDFLSSHLRVFLGFIGITDVEFVAAKDIVPPLAA
ncbi:NAD(P)H-dependent oxidoreductase [Octadecabacter sp. 1_MG-2023]|uniref:FMN-dependent NADH-azoreductase n=1 Tax=unclassified Octadecabacter TaxID=196158 RepID=UPI001C099F47|nr:MULTISPECIES: NAD(P)H-dependent oxidoreductase [unclassified Octadecabacter]MBU2994289.1 NAD(P)H-dependent oxidoreductase [Octadecabacter sp. B2R22]MDO6734422.1 NAD(P)H-dependent oxidoreductase [Octadecabacter sp. 1_MG-2023]